jgi:hypothetical protein
MSNYEDNETNGVNYIRQRNYERSRAVICNTCQMCHRKSCEPDYHELPSIAEETWADPTYEEWYGSPASTNLQVAPTYEEDTETEFISVDESAEYYEEDEDDDEADDADEHAEYAEYYKYYRYYTFDKLDFHEESEEESGGYYY